MRPHARERTLVGGRRDDRAWHPHGARSSSDDPPFLAERFGQAGDTCCGVTRGQDDRPVKADRVRKSIGTLAIRNRCDTWLDCQGLPGVIADAQHATPSKPATSGQTVASRAPTKAVPSQPAKPLY
jgi:nucleotidyltransferase/DNA polymerase involved in DNA repair